VWHSRLQGQLVIRRRLLRLNDSAATQLLNIFANQGRMSPGVCFPRWRPQVRPTLTRGATRYRHFPGLILNVIGRVGVILSRSVSTDRVRPGIKMGCRVVSIGL